MMRFLACVITASVLSPIARASKQPTVFECSRLCRCEAQDTCGNVPQFVAIQSACMIPLTACNGYGNSRWPISCAVAYAKPARDLHRKNRVR